jgi:WD40 repeat protein
MVAALGVVMNTETGVQRFYGGKETAMLPKMEGEQLEFHRDDILALDLSKDRKLVVTGQVGKWPSVHVWDALTCEKISSFQLSKDARGVQAVSISPCKRYVAAVDLSNDHKVYVQNIERDV